MIGLVLVTHGRLAEELRLAMEHVVGPQAAVSTVCIFPEDQLEARREDIRASIAAVDQGDGVVVLTDIMGGTPSNLAFQLCDHRTVEVIAGVNLPLLVKLAKLRGTEPLAEAVARATAAGRKYLASAAEFPDAEHRHLRDAEHRHLRDAEHRHLRDAEHQDAPRAPEPNGILPVKGDTP